MNLLITYWLFEDSEQMQIENFENLNDQRPPPHQDLDEDLDEQIHPEDSPQPNDSNDSDLESAKSLVSADEDSDYVYVHTPGSELTSELLEDDSDPQVSSTDNSTSYLPQNEAMLKITEALNGLTQAIQRGQRRQQGQREVLEALRDLAAGIHLLVVFLVLFVLVIAVLICL